MSLVLSIFFVWMGVNAVAHENCRVCRFRETQHGEGQAFAPPDSNQNRKYAPHREIDVLHVCIDVTPDFEKRTVSGTTRLDFEPIGQPLQVLRLDAVRLAVKDLRCSQEVEDLVNDDRTLTITFRQPIPVGQRSFVEIDHSAEPRQGFYFRTEAMGYPAGDVHVWTQGEPHEARHWFPCVDYPNEKSTTEVICRVPPEMTVLSNGRMMSDDVDASTGLKAVRWLQEKPHANYLICLVAGHFAKLEKQHRDVPLGFYTQPSAKKHAANAFSDTEKIMAFYEEEIGVPFPWPKYDQVTILDFTWGGMENTSLTTLTHRTVQSNETENIHTSHGLDAHEMAHQWFGDYVTCKDWSHLWLNEGFATYYTHLYEGRKSGRDAMLHDLYQDAKGIFRSANDTRPIVYRNYGNASEQFDFRAYPKGSWVLHMLRSQLGEDLYRQAIRRYLEKHALDTVETEDLVAAFEQVSGRSLDRFFDQWVYHGRHPDVQVQYRWDPKEKLAQVVVEQTQTEDRDVLLFEFPVKLRFYLDEQFESFVDHDVEMDQRRQVIHVPLPSQPVLVRFDPELTVLANVTFSLPDAMLLRQLGNPRDALGRVLACEALAKRKSHANVAALHERLKSDPFYAVRIEAAKALAAMDTDESRQALRESLDQSDARVRMQVVRSLAGKYHREVPRLLVRIIDGERNPAIVAAAIDGLAKFQRPAVTRRLIELLDRRSYGEAIAVAAAMALRSHDATEAVPQLQQFVDQHAAQLNGFDQSNVLEAVGHLARKTDQQSPVRDWLADRLSNPKAIVQIGAIRGLGALQDRSAAVILRAWIRDEEGDRIGRAATEAISKLDAESTFVPGEVRELRGEVQRLQRELDALRTEMRTEVNKANSKVKAPHKDQAPPPEEAPPAEKPEPLTVVSRS